MFDFLVWGLIPLSIMVLEIFLTEILGQHLIKRNDTWGQFYNPSKWAAHERTMLFISTAIVFSITIVIEQCTNLHLTGGWKTWAMILGGFGFVLIPLYIKRMFVMNNP